MEQQVWSVQHARQSTLRPRVADPPKPGHFVSSITSCDGLTALPGQGQLIDL